MTLRDRNVLVTGAGGFIGSHLVAALVEAGARVRALVRYNGRGDVGMLADLPPALRHEVEVVSGDIRDPYSVERWVNGREVVFHLAALIGVPYSFEAAGDVVTTNVLGTLHVLEACRRHGVEVVVHTSTSEVYGTARHVPIREDHPLQPQSPYAASKVGADGLAESFHKSFGLPVVTVRPFNTYGPRQSARAIVPTILCQLLTGGPVRLGALDTIRDLTYVEDTARGFLALAGCPEAVGRTVQLGTGQGQTIGELFALCCEATGRTADLRVDPLRIRPGKSEVGQLIADPTLAATLAGWRPEVDLREGIRRTADYVAGHLDAYQPGAYSV